MEIASPIATSDARAPAPSIASVPSGNPHFALLGGVEAITRLVERFYLHMDTLPEAAAIRAMHPANLGPVKEVLVRFLSEWMGGPPRYSTERGHPRLRQRHLPFPIGVAERDAWMLCMRLALQDIVSDAALAHQLENAFFKTADFIRNDKDHHHEHHR
ncbi:group II truncated hemoglobin [Niveibacterium sp. SC-1]|uniref:group II truncated hemoglobin n=1 Tax=Niveibacterium sp. SC-1 TaxID=3135646 RepID=UPI00311F0A8F